jgi:hypothetical protein
MKVLYADLWPLRRAGRKLSDEERAYRARVRANKRAAKARNRATCRPVQQRV